MSFSMFLYLIRLMSMEKKLDLFHEPKIYDACKNYLLINNLKVKDYFKGYINFNDDQAIDLEEVLDLIWRF